MVVVIFMVAFGGGRTPFRLWRDRKSTRLNSSHSQISYAVFCLKKKKIEALEREAADLVRTPDRAAAPPERPFDVDAIAPRPLVTSRRWLSPRRCLSLRRYVACS